MDLEYIESLAELVSRTTATEVTVRRGEQAVTVRRSAGGVRVLTPAETADATSIRSVPGNSGIQLPAMLPHDHALLPTKAAANGHTEPFEIVRAHRVGVFHRAADEAGEPLVSVGDWAAAQQHLGCIESMRVFDEIDNPTGGKVIGVFVGDGAPVEYGQPLFHIRVSALPDDTAEPVEED